MFTKIFSRPQRRPNDDNETSYTSPAASVKSDDTPKSILRRQGSNARNFHRSVSWSTTYETLEHQDLDYLDSESAFEQYEGLEDPSYSGTDAAAEAAASAYDKKGFDSRFRSTAEDSYGATFKTQTTYETREGDGFQSRFRNAFTAETTFDETREGEDSFDTRNVGSNVIDTRDNGTTFETDAAGTATSSSLERSEEANEANHAQGEEEAKDEETTSVKSQEGIEQTVNQMEEIKKATMANDDNESTLELNKPIPYDNRNSSLGNLACAASNVTEASELADRYGLDEHEAKSLLPNRRRLLLAANNSYVSEGEQLFDDKYHGLEDKSMTDGALSTEDQEKKCVEPVEVVELVGETPVAVEEEAVTAAVDDAPLTLEVDVSHEEQSPLSPMSDVDAVNIFVPGEVQAIEEDLIHEAPSDVLTIGSLSEEQLSFDEVNKANSDDGSLASKKEHGYADLFLEQNAADKSMGHIGLILPFLDRLQCSAFVTGDSFSVLDAVDSREWLEYATSTQDEHDEEENAALQEMSGSLRNDEYEGEVESVPTASYDNESDEDEAHEVEKDEAEYQVEEDGNVRVRVNGEETSNTSENDSSNESPEENSRDTSGANDRMSYQSAEKSAHTGEVITFPAKEDDSIPSNESRDEPIQIKKAGFKPLASFRKRISGIIGKSNKSKKQSKPATPLSPNETLHDRVYNNIVPETQSLVSTALILDDLEIIEKTARVMYQDRFSCTPSFLNPGDGDENVEANISVPRSKRKDNDINSQQSKTTVESALSPMFRSYFAAGEK